jgi:hypothetical protein
VSVKRIHISFLILVFVFFPAFGGIFNILICPTYGQAFDKDNSFISYDNFLGSATSLKNLYSSSRPPVVDFLVYSSEWEKLGNIPIFEHQRSPELTQRFSFVNGNYFKNTTLSSYPIIKRKIDYRKASIIGGLNLVAVTVGFHKAVNIWGESKGRFHIKDDWKGDGLAQTDEVSHFMWGYKMTQFFHWAYDWVGFSPKTSRALSSSESALILTLVEYPIDAYNPKQGLGVSDLIFDYLGVGLAIARKHQSWLNDFDFKISWKKNIFSQNKTPFAQTYEEYDNFIYWLTYRTKFFFPKKLLCFGFGYSVTHSGMQSQRELYGGIGISIPDFVSLFGKKLGDKSKFLEILYPNIHIKL